MVFQHQVSFTKKIPDGQSCKIYQDARLRLKNSQLVHNIKSSDKVFITSSVFST